MAMQATLIQAQHFLGVDHSDTTAMVLVGDRIASVGSAEQLRADWPDAELVDYGNGCVIPGFNDAHMHLGMMVTQSLGADLSPERTPGPADIATSIREVAAEGGDWVRGFRYDHMQSTAGEPLTRDDLDALIPDRPTIVGHISAHWGVANSAALQLAGVDSTTADPRGGSYGRDADGRLNGIVSEQAYFDFVYPSLSTKPWLTPDVESEQALDALERSVQTLLAAGITSIGDAMMGPGELRLFQQARRQKSLRVRVNALMTFPHLPALRDAGVTDGFGDDWLRIGGIKAFVDGAVAGRSCAVAEPFEGTQDHGILTTDQQFITELAADCGAAGLTLAVHANGERAIEIVLGAVETLVDNAMPVPPLRIEHCSVVTPQIIARMAALRISAVPFAGYPLYHGDKLRQWYGQQRLERMFAHRWFIDSGINVAGSSDYPCGPLPPLAGIQSCVTRTSVSGEACGVSQRISVEEAIRLYTHGSAQVEQLGEVKGLLRPGYLADFTVLQHDPRTVDPDQIADIPILATWVAATKQWER